MARHGWCSGAAPSTQLNIVLSFDSTKASPYKRILRANHIASVVSRHPVGPVKISKQEGECPTLADLTIRGLTSRRTCWRAGLNVSVPLRPRNLQPSLLSVWCTSSRRTFETGRAFIKSWRGLTRRDVEPARHTMGKALRLLPQATGSDLKGLWKSQEGQLAR
jgi:hypothetical protein